VNQGQTDAQVQFLAHVPGYTLFLAENEAVMTLTAGSHSTAVHGKGHHPAQQNGPNPTATDVGVIRMELAGANPRSQVQGLDELPGKVNYFLGNNPSQWRTDVPTFARVEYQAVYPGIDLVYYGSQQQLEYDFNVAGGADPGAIRLNFNGADTVRLDAGGNLVLTTGDGPVLQHKPVLYQDIAGHRQVVSGGYVVQGRQVGFWVGAHDLSRPLVIDPVLSYSTYLGGSGTDEGNGIAVDASGNAYVTGSTTSVNFPTKNAFQSNNGGLGNAFVTKLNASGSALIYSTYLGGNMMDDGNAIAVDYSGNAYVTGDTLSTNFPTTSGAFQKTFGGGGTNAFVTRLNAAGSALVYSTYLGGSYDDAGAGIAVDTAGDAYVAGDTSSTNFPTTSGAFQKNLAGSGFLEAYDNAFFSKLDTNASGSASLVYSSYLGGNEDINGFGGFDAGAGVAIDTAGNAYLTGEASSTNFPTTSGAFQQNIGRDQFGDPTYDAFVAKFNPNLPGNASLVYSTYLGGNGDDYGNAITVDSSGRAYVTGSTDSTNFPTLNPYQATNKGLTSNAFVSEMNAAGSGLVFSTYLGGSQDDEAFGIARDSAGQVYVTGDTTSPDFPTVNALQGTLGGGEDVFVSELNAAGNSLLFSTFLGGSGNDDGFAIAVDSSQNVYVTGLTESTNFPTTAGAFQTSKQGATSAFITKINLMASGASSLKVTPSSDSVVAGNPLTVTVTALDANGNIATGYTGTVHFSSSDGKATVPVDYTFTATDNGVHVFTDGVTLRTAGSQTVTATDTQNGSINGSATVTVLPAEAATLVLTDLPNSVTAGMPATITVTAKDAFGNVATGYMGTVTFSSSDTGASLPGPYTFTATDSGTHTFPNGVTLVTAGPQTVTVSDGTLAATANVTVNPAPAVQFQITAPASAYSGTPFDITVTALDPYGNIDTNYSGTVTFSSSDNDPGVILPPNYTFTGADSGVHTFPGGVTLITQGNQTVTATDTINNGISGTATITVL
jgi:hypothetical protein